MTENLNQEETIQDTPSEQNADLTQQTTEPEATPQDEWSGQESTGGHDGDNEKEKEGLEDKKEKKECKESKKRELQKQVEQLTAALAEEKDRYARMFAEYENFRRRSQKERDNVYADAYAEALGEVMPMVDNLERALQCGEGEQLHKGLEMVMNQFQEMLKKLGIETFGEKGDTFDPNIHHAIMHEDNENLPENSIVEVFQRGYKKGERIIRCAMVKVAN